MYKSLGLTMIVGSTLIWHSKGDVQTDLLHVFLSAYILIGVILLIAGIRFKKRKYHGYSN